MYPYHSRAMMSQIMGAKRTMGPNIQTKLSEVLREALRINESKFEQNESNGMKDKEFFRKYLTLIIEETEKYPGPMRHWKKRNQDSCFGEENIVIRSRMSRVNASFVFFIFDAIWKMDEDSISDFLNQYSSNFSYSLSSTNFSHFIENRNKTLKNMLEDFSIVQLPVDSCETCFEQDYEWVIWSLEDVLELVLKTETFWTQSQFYSFNFYTTEKTTMNEEEIKNYTQEILQRNETESKLTVREFLEQGETKKTLEELINKRKSKLVTK